MSPQKSINQEVSINRYGLNPNDIVGKKFGRLKIIKFEKQIMESHLAESKHHNKYFYSCECDCGNIKIIERMNLFSNFKSRSDFSLRSRGCGCLRGKHKNRVNKLAKGEANFNRLLWDYKKKAKKRNLFWALTKEEFQFFTKQKCFYCGKLPIQQRLHTRRSNGVYFYNGLDRLDNNKGYIKENIVPCCGKCNQAKSDLSYDEFIAYIKRVYNFINQKKESEKMKKEQIERAIKLFRHRQEEAEKETKAYKEPANIFYTGQAKVYEFCADYLEANS